MNQEQIKLIENYKSNSRGLLDFYESLLKDIMQSSKDESLTYDIKEALDYGEKIWEKRWDYEWSQHKNRY
jgi:hypothetical protein